MNGLKTNNFYPTAVRHMHSLKKTMDSRPTTVHHMRDSKTIDLRPNTVVNKVRGLKMINWYVNTHLATVAVTPYIIGISRRYYIRTGLYENGMAIYFDSACTLWLSVGLLAPPMVAGAAFLSSRLDRTICPWQYAFVKLCKTFVISVYVVTPISILLRNLV